MPGNLKNAYALLIAVDQNSEPSAALPAVAADAKALHDVLVHPQRCAYPPENVRLLSAAESTRNGIFEGLDWLNEKLASVADGDSTAVVYFTGHGHVVSGIHYLIPYDLNLRRIQSSAIRATDFAEEIARLTPRRLLIALDCCHAAGMAVKGIATATFGAAVPAALLLPYNKALDGMSAGGGRAVLSSCQPQQRAYLRADGRMSIFTYHLVEALTGHAPASAGSAEVLVSDLISHLDRKVPESALHQHNVQQMPDHYMTGNFPIALILGGAGLCKGVVAPDPFAPLPTAISRTASLAGGGAIAQSTVATVFGSRGVYVGGNSTGKINTGIQIIHSSEKSETTKLVIAQYLDSLVKDLTGLQLDEIDTAYKTRQSPLQLADVYVALNTTQHIPLGLTLAQWLTHDQRKTRPVAALEALAAHRQLTLLGKPGSGKSTFGASVLLALAQAWQGHDGELVKLGATWTHGALLPIRVILRRFAERLPAGDAPARAGDLWAFIGDELEASGHGVSADAVNYLQQLARSHGALFLFDGLDECGDSARRDRVVAAVNEMVHNSGPNCRFVLTARPYAKLDGADPSAGVYLLADLDDAQIEQFIRNRYTALVNSNWLSPGKAAEKMGDLLAARQRHDLQPLAQNPLLLTLMTALHTDVGHLPDDRVDLYNQSVDLLMLRWNRQVGVDKALLEQLDTPGLRLSDLREVLEKLAFEVHQQNVGSKGAADIGEQQLLRAFRPLLENSWDKAAIVVDYIEKRAGLLLCLGSKDGKDNERQFTFPHRTFQEFLAACHLNARSDFSAECVRLARNAATHWQVVLPLAARLAKAERGASAADELIGGRSIADSRVCRRPDASDWSCAQLAATQLLEIGLGAINKNERTRAIAERVTSWLVAALPLHPGDGGAPARQRAQIGDLLATLGDPRFNPQHFHLPADASFGFEHIAADLEFRIGTRQADASRVEAATGRNPDEDEINETLTPTPEFHIARYPVTVAQFKAFVDNTGFTVGDADALHDPDNRPVSQVSWDEAAAYCDWLNGVLTDSPALDNHPIGRLVRNQGWRVALPSELEWEKAARGGLRDAVFSWGDQADTERANYDETAIGDTSPVGCFPANGFGLYDMIGNVWEWTATPYDKTAMLVRGGSWDGGRDDACCAVRGRNHPDVRSDDLGFRVVLRSAPV